MAASRRAIGTLASSSTGGNTTKPISHKSDEMLATSTVTHPTL